MINFPGKLRPTAIGLGPPSIAPGVPQRKEIRPGPRELAGKGKHEKKSPEFRFIV